jgi:hypothetical protein
MQAGLRPVNIASRERLQEEAIKEQSKASSTSIGLRSISRSLSGIQIFQQIGATR